ncbi:hypothetical protein EVAR_8415_1 [Eumeta japonica]|uniref:Uncharacterized protein n=1 Tax=Eumeta variegata TaxID=151549 RepID=A0A4C1WFA0_EUMVA|nr:hypothetical protein EVAR_8415_1 [Eumeta japonica]
MRKQEAVLGISTKDLKVVEKEEVMVCEVRVNLRGSRHGGHGPRRRAGEAALLPDNRRLRPTPAGGLSAAVTHNYSGGVGFSHLETDADAATWEIRR